MRLRLGPAHTLKSHLAIQVIRYLVASEPSCKPAALPSKIKAILLVYMKKKQEPCEKRAWQIHDIALAGEHQLLFEWFTNATHQLAFTGSFGMLLSASSRCSKGWATGFRNGIPFKRESHCSSRRRRARNCSA